MLRSTEVRVQQESQYFRALFDEAPLPYQSLDSEGRLLNVNRAWQDELGYEKHEVLGWWFGDFVCSDQKSLFRERYRQFAEEESVQGVVLQLLRKDGSLLHVSFSGRIARDKDGRFLRSQCMFFDLSKRSEAEEQLRQSEELRMAFMELADEGFALFDAQLCLIYANQESARMLRAAPEELIGKTMLEISPETEQTDRYAEYQRVLETGESFSIDDSTQLERFGNRRFAIHAFKVSDNLGIILRDVTEAKLSERQLLESEARWRALTEGTPDHVMILSLDLKIEHANSPLLGLNADRLVGTYVCSHTAESRRAEVRQILETVIETGTLAAYDTIFVDSNGMEAHYESRAVPRRVDGESVGLIVSSRDITQRKADAERIDRLLKRQTAMADLAMDFGRASNLLDVHRTVYIQVKALMDADTFIISRLDAAQKLLYASFVVFDGDEQNTGTLPPLELEASGKGTQSQVIRTGEPLIIEDYHAVMAETETRYRIPWEAHAVEKLGRGDGVGELPRSSLLVPMRIRDEVIGVMQVQSCQLDSYKSEDAELLSGLANITAVAIENRNLISNSQTVYEGIIHALAKAIELRDPYTSQHQEGVARVAVKIAEKMMLPGDQVRAIELSAYIHDIGKVVIPAEILSKPSSLTSAQMSIVRSHVEATHEVLEGIAFPWPIDEIVCQHHERLDGSGYPNSMKDDDIRLEARILAVADIVDAMTSHRPYRPAFSLEETMDELRRLRGSALDPTVVDTCLGVLERDGIPTAESA